jgi:methyl coenzyme M reductase subunit D
MYDHSKHAAVIRGRLDKITERKQISLECEELQKELDLSVQTGRMSIKVGDALEESITAIF